MTQSYIPLTKPAREIENLESKIRYLEEANSEPNPRADLNKAELEKLRELRDGWKNEQDEIRAEENDGKVKK